MGEPSLYWTKALILSILKYGGNLEVVDEQGQTALLFAAKNGHFDVVKQLIENGANIHHVDDKQNSALLVAMNAQVSFELFSLLVHSGIDVHQCNSSGVDALQKAFYLTLDKKFPMLLLEYGVDINSLFIGDNIKQIANICLNPFLPATLIQYYHSSVHFLNSCIEGKEDLLTSENLKTWKTQRLKGIFT